MLDPITITSLSIKVASSAGQLFLEVKALRARYKAVPRNIQLFSSQISALRTATTRVSAWLEQLVEKEDDGQSGSQQQFEDDLKDVLEGCDLLIDILAEHIKRFVGADEGLSATAKARFLWSEQDLDEHRRALGYQCDALMLILKSFELAPGKSMNRSSRDLAETRRAIAQAKDAASSIISGDTSSTKTIQQKIEFGAPIPAERHEKNAFDVELDKSGPYAASKRNTSSSTVSANTSSPLTPASSSSEKSVSDAHSRLSQALEKSSQLEEVVESQRTTISKLKQERDMLKIVQTYISDCTVLQAQVEERDNSLRLTTQKMEGERNDYVRRAAKYEQYIAHLEKDRHGLEKAMTQQLAERQAALGSQEQAMIDQKRSHEEAVASLNASMSTLRAQNKTFEGHIKQLVNEREKIEIEFRHKWSRRDAAFTDDMNKLQAHAEKLASENQTQERTLVEIRATLEVEKAAKQGCQRKLEETNNQLRKQDAQFKSDTRDLEADHRSKYMAMVEKLHHLQEALHYRTEEFTSLRKVNTALKDELVTEKKRMLSLVEEADERYQVLMKIVCGSDEDAVREAKHDLDEATAKLQARLAAREQRRQQLSKHEQDIRQLMESARAGVKSSISNSDKPASQTLSDQTPQPKQILESIPAFTTATEKPGSLIGASAPAGQQLQLADPRQTALQAARLRAEKKEKGNQKHSSTAGSTNNTTTSPAQWKKRLSRDLVRTASAPKLQVQQAGQNIRPPIA